MELMCIRPHTGRSVVPTKQQTQLMLPCKKTSGVYYVKTVHLDQTGGESNDPKWLS